MIAVHRERHDATGTVIRPKGDWDARSREATKVARREAQDHDARADVYGSDAVRAALEELFQGKCAYCGVDITSGTWDVEHFRPKGRVQERPDHPGYYWLAYEWSNLYAACQPCNQRRRDKPTWGDPTVGPSAGKLDQFPLTDESTRAMVPGDDLDAESRLLIDPCGDDPEDYLRYEADGRIFPVNKAPKGEKSIEVYALNRKRLVTRRQKVWGEAVNFLKLIRLAQSAGDDAAARLARKMLEERMERGEHAGVVRFVEKNRKVFTD